MKVKELIEFLQKQDPEMEVLHNSDYIHTDYHDAGAELVRMAKLSSGEYYPVQDNVVDATESDHFLVVSIY